MRSNAELLAGPAIPVRKLSTRAFALGYLIIGAGEHVLRFAPPLVISDAQLTEGIAATHRLIAGLRRSA